MKKKASMKVMSALKKRRAKIAMDAVQTSLDLFNTVVADEAEEKKDEVTDGVVADDTEESLPDGVTVTQEGDDTVRFSFKFKYVPDKYDSTVDNGGNEQAVDTVEETVTDTETAVESSAQDAYPTQKGPENAVANASAQCKATFEECKAKNPYACKYHGQKLMEADIYALLAAKGAKSAKVQLNQLSPGAYEADVTCINTPAEKKAALAAIKAFLKKQGIDQTSVVDADYDKKEKMATAFFDVDNLDPKAESEKEMHAPPPKGVVEKAEKAEEKAGQEPKEGEPKKEKVSPNPSENVGTGITDEEILDSLKNVFGDKIKFDIGSSDFEMWKTAITDGVGTDGMQLSNTNKGYLHKMVDELPDGDPVANVAAATLAKLNAETGKATAVNPKKAKKPKEEPKQHAETTETAKNANEEDDASAKNPDADGGGYSSEKFMALKNEGVEVGADKDADVTAKMQEVAAHVADMKKAEQTMNELSKAIGNIKEDPDISDETKDIIKNAISKEFSKANEEYAKASKDAGSSLAEFEQAIEKFKADKENKIISKAKDAVKAVEEEVKDTFPYKDGLIKTCAISEANNATEDFKNECANYGIDADEVEENAYLIKKAMDLKHAASHYSQTLTDFSVMSGSAHYKPESLEEQAQKVAAAGKELVETYKTLEVIKRHANQSLQAKVKENQDAEAAKAAQTQASAPSASATPTDKKTAIKAKISAMTPKEKAAKAIDILKKKIAADPGNAEYKAKLAKFEALAAKLG